MCSRAHASFSALDSSQFGRSFGRRQRQSRQAGWPGFLSCPFVDSGASESLHGTRYVILHLTCCVFVRRMCCPSLEQCSSPATAISITPRCSRSFVKLHFTELQLLRCWPNDFFGFRVFQTRVVLPHCSKGPWLSSWHPLVTRHEHGESVRIHVEHESLTLLGARSCSSQNPFEFPITQAEFCCAKKKSHEITLYGANA